MNAKEMKEYQDKVLVVLSDGHIGFNEEEIEVIRDVLAVGVEVLMSDGIY